MRVTMECELDCPTCGDIRVFEQPPCRDGHGQDCPEWACTACGTALLLDPVIEPSDSRRAVQAVRAA